MGVVVDLAAQRERRYSRQYRYERLLAELPEAMDQLAAALETLIAAAQRDKS